VVGVCGWSFPVMLGLPALGRNYRSLLGLLFLVAALTVVGFSICLG
jgi:hypothetical protein